MSYWQAIGGVTGAVTPFRFSLAARVPVGTYMTSAAPVRARSGEPVVLVTGSALAERVVDLLGCSRWTVKQIESVDAAVEPIGDGSIPLVICGAREWRDVVEAARRAQHPPAIVVLTGAPSDDEWMDVLQAGAHYLDTRNPDMRNPDMPHLGAAPLFALLSLLWRGRRRGV